MSPGNTACRRPPARSPAWRLARRVAIAVAGGVLVVAGAVMMVLPGPGLLAMFAGLALLATEFPAARRAQRRLRAAAHRAQRRLRAAAHRAQRRLRATARRTYRHLRAGGPGRPRANQRRSWNRASADRRAASKPAPRLET